MRKKKSACFARNERAWGACQRIAGMRAWTSHYWYDGFMGDVCSGSKGTTLEVRCLGRGLRGEPAWGFFLVELWVFVPVPVGRELSR
jgi:hypothetical protein